VGTRKFCCETVDVVKVAVRLVLVLLVKFVVVELLVVELGSLGWRRWTSGMFLMNGLSGMADGLRERSCMDNQCSVSCMRAFLQSVHTRLMAQHLDIHSSSLLVGCSMNLVTRNLAVVGTSTAESTSQIDAAQSRTLNSDSLAHNRTAAAQDL